MKKKYNKFSKMANKRENPTRRALFLDRDGVINEATPRGVYLLEPKQFKLLDGIVNLLKAAHEKDYVVPVVTNQPAVAKGLLPQHRLDLIHARMHRLLPGLIDKVYVCPHVNEDACDCRKPLAGMLHQATEELSLDLDRSLIVGDSNTDVLAGQAAGVKTVFIRNAYNANELPKCEPDYVVEKLTEVIPLL